MEMEPGARDEGLAATRRPLLLPPTPPPSEPSVPPSPGGPLRRDSGATEDSERAGEGRAADADEYLVPRAGAPRGSGRGPELDVARALLPLPSADYLGRLRLVGFLGLQLLSLTAQVFLMVTFWLTKDRNSFSGLLALFLLSGLFCAHAAWHCEAPAWGGRVLPLKGLCAPLRWLLLLPFGFLQIVIVVLALEDYSAKSRRYSSGRPSETIQRPTSNKFHCKAVVGLFEGLGSAGICLYAFWTMDYPPPPAKPITASKWEHEKTFVAVCCWILATSAGLGVLELDFCVSRFVAKRMKRSLGQEFLQIVFRTSEVSIRMCLYIWFTVSLRVRKSNLWWFPLTADIAGTALLVVLFGGAEKNWLVRVLCSFPCMFANIFLFIDSPYKRQAAIRLSRWLTLRNAVTMVLLPVIGMVWGEQSMGDEWQGHSYMIATATGMVPIYWFLLWFLAVRKVGKFTGGIPDIYSACYSGSVDGVQTAIRKLTQSAAVGLNMNCADVDGWTPLMLAAWGGHAEVCKLLVEEGAQASIGLFADNRLIRGTCFLPKRRRWTAVHMAAARGHVEVLRAIVESDSGRQATDIDPWKDAFLDTPLHVAARKGHANVVRLLAARRRPWMDAINSRDERPIDVANGAEVQAALNEAAVMPEGEGVVQSRSRDAIRASVGDIEQAWQAIAFHIQRTSGEEVEKVAPGLCSYVASSCGGALGRLFLANAPRVHHGNESTDSLSSSPGASMLSAGGLPVVSPDGGSSFYAEGAFSMEDLEPVDRQGEPIPAWRQLRDLRGCNRFHVSSIPLEAVLGEGSYGIVWRAKDRNHVQYAVKTIKSHSRGASPQATRECEVADRVKMIPHPCLVKLFHVHNYADQGTYVMVMEFAVGGDLFGQIMKQKRSLPSYRPPKPAHKWIGHVFLGLEHMHLRMKTLLRDLKPDNVVLDRHGIAKLTDFGFGRFGVESTGIWSFGIPSGSPGYVAPEVLRQREYDSRCDLYSYGALVWVLLTGGLVNDREAKPPIGQMQHRGDFAAHFHDCRRLAECISDPLRNNARQLAETARDFVAGLVHEQPERRRLHEEIRRHPFMVPLNLPAVTAPPSDVEKYLRSVRIAVPDVSGRGSR